MPGCILKNCKNHTRNVKKDSGITFHRFPTISDEKTEAWIKFVQNNRNEYTWLPRGQIHICSEHFKDDDKYITKGGRLYLKKNAVPWDKYASNSPEPEPVEPISEPGSDSNSIFDTPRKISLKRKLSKETSVRKQLQENLKKNQRQNRHLKQKCESYKKMVKSLKSKFGFDSIADNDLMAKAELVDLYKSYIKKNKQNRHVVLYSAPLRKFAITLHYYSLVAYKYVRETYNKALPHPSTISRWYSTVNAEPGFTKESFDVLKQKVSSSDDPVVCSLVFDEITIRQQKLFHKNHKLGSINFGAGPVAGVEETKATHALVFMLVALNEAWKLPVGYFLIAGIEAEKKAMLIKMCLEKCHEVGVTVANLTFDGCQANFAAAEVLGCELSDMDNLKTFFPHPSTSEKVCIFIDPCHIIKIIRNTFEKKRLFFDLNNGLVKWQLLYNLNKLQQSEGLTFAKKLTPRHINFRNQIMKVKLATQMLSRSVAKALETCDELLKSNRFKDSAATVNFITLMINFFDVMNSRKCDHGFKRPIDKNSKKEIFAFLNQVKTYILQLEVQIKTRRVIKRKNREAKVIMNIEKKKVVESASKTGFVSAIICIESTITLYKCLVEERKLIQYISMHRISQHHLELFFGLIRKHGGYNNNPNVIQFRAEYKKVFNHLELKSSFTDNCIPMDNFTILNSSSVNVINNTTDLNRQENEEDYEILESTTLESDSQAETNCGILSKMLDYENAIATQLLVGYISGFVSRSLIKVLKCEDCVDSLTAKEKLPHHKLITIKDMSGLCYSSEDVFKICLSTEMVIGHLIRGSGGKELSSKYTPTYIAVNTLKLFLEKEVFICLTEHAYNQPSTYNHRIHMIRVVIHKYTTLRLKHEVNVTNDCFANRQKVTKLILF